jgi:divalent metal cation (Fe/Co/Zn/Cd) transporter
VAAVMTYAAVRVSGPPPDRDHPYGHGKIENLSALGETFLLLVTCVWIVYEAARRLAFNRVDVEVTAWSSRGSSPRRTSRCTPNRSRPG